MLLQSFFIDFLQIREITILLGKFFFIIIWKFFDFCFKFNLAWNHLKIFFILFYELFCLFYFFSAFLNFVINELYFFHDPFFKGTFFGFT